MWPKCDSSFLNCFLSTLSHLHCCQWPIVIICLSQVFMNCMCVQASHTCIWCENWRLYHSGSLDVVHLPWLTHCGSLAVAPTGFHNKSPSTARPYHGWGKEKYGPMHDELIWCVCVCLCRYYSWSRRGITSVSRSTSQLRVEAVGFYNPWDVGKTVIIIHARRVCLGYLELYIKPSRAVFLTATPGRHTWSWWRTFER